MRPHERELVPISPILKWAGSKRASVDPIRRALFGDRALASLSVAYAEPFVGSASVLLHLRSQGYIGPASLSDRNPRLMALYLALQNAPDELSRELDTLDWSESWKETYAARRAEFNALACWVPSLEAARLRADNALVPLPEEELHDVVRTAALFLWLNRTGFNGLYRENSKGGFNVPAGSYTRPNRPAASALSRVSEALKRAILWYGDVATLDPSGVSKGDRIYLDPPYVPLSDTSNFTGYSSGGFSWRDQLLLAELAVSFARRGAVVVISNHDTPQVREELYPVSRGFEHLDSIMVRRSINSDVAGRGKVAELLVRIRE